MGLFAVTAAKAQWTENASSVFLTNGTKNVGIGTVAPAFVLDVQRAGNASASFKSSTGTANLIIDRGSSAATSSVSYRTAGSPTWQTGTIGTNNFAIRNIALGSPALSINNTDNFVGIGTNAPIKKLHVVGSGRFEGNLEITNNATFGNSIGITGDVTASGTVNGNTFSGNSLNVTGGVTAGGAVSGNTFSGNSLNVTGGVTAGGALNGNTLNVSGLTQLGDSVRFGSVELFYDAGSNTIGTNSSLICDVGSFSDLGRVTNKWSNLFLASNANIGGDAIISGNASVTGVATLSGGLTVSNGINVISGNISSGGDLYTSAGNGVINCGGDSMSASINIMSDFFTLGTSNLNANGDEDLFIGGDLEVVGGGFKTGGGAWAVRSDARLKKDVVDFTDGLAALLKMHPVKFKYNNLMPNSTEQEYVGIIAQEMQEIAPYMVEEKPMGQIVEEDANGKEVIIKQGTNYLSYDPNALWYITVNAIKEQQTIIEKQAKRIEALEAMISNNGVMMDKTGLQNANTSRSTMEQNQPNPFNQNTVINYNLTDENAKAFIVIRDLSGNQMKKVALTQRGKGQVTINAYEFSQGTYTYSLEVNGQSIDTKLMVLVN